MKKLLVWSAALLSVLLLSIIVLPYIFKDKILNEIKNAANERLNAHVSFSNDINLSLVSHFPDFTVGINNLSIVGVGEFEHDTLLSLNQLNITIDLMSVISGNKMDIKRIDVISPLVHAIVLENGNVNWNIVKTVTDSTNKQDSDTTSSAFTIKLRYFGIEKAIIKYEDRQDKTNAIAENFSHTLAGDFTQEIVDLQTSNTIEKLTITENGVKYLNEAKLVANATLDANLKSNTYTLKENEIKLNHLVFSLIGSVTQRSDAMDLDLTFNAREAGIKEFISLIPGMYIQNYNDVKTTGNLAFSASIKGAYTSTTLPAFNLSLNVTDASVQYPKLPEPIKNIHIDLKVTNSDGSPNNTHINLNRFYATVADNTMEARLALKNVIDDPYIDAELKGKINLGTISKAIPMESGVMLAGLIETNVVCKGFASKIEKKAYDKFDAHGEFQMHDVRIQRKEKPENVTIKTALITLSPTHVSVNPFKGAAGSSDFEITGNLYNFIPYVLNDDKIEGNLTLKSGTLNFNEMLSDTDATAESTATGTDTVKLSAPEVPANIDFTFSSSIDKIIYSNMEIQNLKGQIVVRNKQVRLNSVELNTLGSTIKISGYYSTEITGKPKTEMNLDINNLDIKKAALSFNTVKKLTPIAENMTGSISAKCSISSALNTALDIDYNTLVASGQLEVNNAFIKGVKVFNATADILKNEKLRNPGIDQVKIKFMVENGIITTEPFDLNISGQKLTLYGTTGLDQRIDYTGLIKIPGSAVGNMTTTANKTLIELNKKAGTSVNIDSDVTLKILINGTFTSPVITTNLAETAKNEAADIANQLKNEAERKRKELEDKAKQELNKAKAEAEAKAKAEAEKLKAEAEHKVKAEQERIKREAENKAKAEQERLKKQAEEEAKKRLKGIFKP